MKKMFYTLGLLSPIFYAATVVLGGILWHGYSHIRQPISELEAGFAPHMPAVVILFALANLFGLLFGIGVYLLGKEKQSRIIKVTGTFLVISGIISLIFYFFPQDPIGGALTFKGTVHLILASLSSLLTMLIVFSSAYAFQFLNKAKSFSITMGIIIFITGMVTAYATKNLLNIFGIFERLTIGTYMLWLFVISLALFRNSNRLQEK